MENTPKQLSEAQLSHFLNRFQNFYDALIRETQVFFMTKNTQTHAKVILSVIDHQEPASETWVNVTLEIDDVSTFRLLEGAKISCVVLTEGLNIKFFGEDIYLDFCPLNAEPESIKDFQNSYFLIVGKRVVWSASSYSE